MSCVNFIDFTDVSFTEVDPINGYYKFTVLSSWNSRMNYVARIRAFNTGLGKEVFSPNFLLLTEASQECNIAVLTIPSPEPSVVFNPVKPLFGQANSVSITTWPEYENDVCPEFCHGAADCGNLVYSLRCNSLSVGPFNDDPHALQKFNATIASDGQTTVNAWEILNVLVPYHCIVRAELGAELGAGPFIETMTPSDITFDICFSFDLGCKINTWAP